MLANIKRRKNNDSIIISTDLRQKTHISILLIIQERQKLIEIPSHFNVFDLDKLHFNTYLML